MKISKLNVQLKKFKNGINLQKEGISTDKKQKKNQILKVERHGKKLRTVFF